MILKCLCFAPWRTGGGGRCLRRQRDVTFLSMDTRNSVQLIFFFSLLSDNNWKTRVWIVCRQAACTLTVCRGLGSRGAGGLVAQGPPRFSHLSFH